MRYLEATQEEEDGIGIEQSLSILSSNAHRNTSQWRLVEEQHFKNGRLEEVHTYVVNHYDKPDEHFSATKFLVFEAEAMARAYIMENIEDQLADVRGEYDDED
jgi:hypothetical protein